MGAGAQTFTQRLQKQPTAGQGSVTIHQSDSIDQLVNSTVLTVKGTTATTTAPTTPTTPKPATPSTTSKTSTTNLTSTTSLSDKEVELIQKMNEFGAAVEQAGKDYSPSGIANYCYELTKVFNQFYHDYSILNEPDENIKAMRLMLAKNVAKIIKNAMGLLGIEVPERM